MDAAGNIGRLALAATPGLASFMVDRDLRYILADGPGLAAQNLSSRDFLGRTVMEVHQQASAPACEDFKLALQGGTFEREHSVGDRKYLTRGGPVRGADGEICGAVATSVDVTVKWRGEQLSVAQEEALRDIAAGNSAELCVLRLGERAAALRPGLRIAALIADRSCSRFERVMAPMLGPAFESSLKGAPIGPEPIGTCGWAVHHARVVACADVANDPLWSNMWRDLCLSLDIRAVHSSPILDAQGRAVGSFMMAFEQPRTADPFEITLAQFACNALQVLLEREANQRSAMEHAAEGWRHFERLADSGPAMIWTIDTRGMTTYASRAWYEYTGMQPGEALGVGWLDAVHPDDRDLVFEQMTTSLQDRSGVRLDFRMRHRQDGSYRWVLADVRASTDDDGRLSGYIGSVADIDDVRRAHQLLALEDRRKDEFLATLAHELRNPLAPIGNGLALMRRARDLGDVDPEILDMMERQFRQLTRLVDDLLDTSRIKTGRLQLQLQPVDVRDIVAFAIEAVKPKIEQRAQRLIVSGVDQGLHVAGDAVRLAQVVSNILDNAAKYTPTHGNLALTLFAQGDEVLVTVSDDGQGISPDSQFTAFELFDRAGQKRGRKIDGLGVGLYLVRALVQLHGGEVELRSDGLGQGTTVTVRLPRLVAEAALPPPSHGKPAVTTRTDERMDHRGTTRRLKVLVVDDNEDAAVSLGTLFESLHCDTTVTHSGAAALRVASITEPELVVLDIGMPGMDGYELARRLRRLPGMEEAILVALTGWDQASDREQSEQAGIDLHWVKPIGLAAISDLVCAMLEEAGVRS